MTEMRFNEFTKTALGVAAAVGMCLCGTVLADAPQANLPGTEFLSEVEHLVVVYPVGSGEDEEINRLSGQRRAGFLNHLFGYEAEFVADDEVTEAQLASDLLVLGWNNRLLGTDEAPRPFVREGPGWRFANAMVVQPDQDLMFTTASPYNPKRRLFFWTRIDLELDKFSVLPFLGSDWAIYRGYEVVAQGMFDDSGVWPPVRNPYAENVNDDVRAIYPAQGTSEHYTIHYPRELITRQQRDAILAARERALAAALASLGQPEDELKIALYLFPDLDVKETLSGVPDPMHSLGRSAELFMLPRDAGSDSPHEEVHLVAQQVLGPCHHTALHEGLAMVAGRRPDAGKELSLYAAALVDKDAVPTVAELLDEEGIRVLNLRGLGFPAAGLLVEWILDQGGTQALKKIYPARPLTEQRLAESLGLSPAGANTAFRKYVVAQAKQGGEDFRFQQARAEASQMGQDGDWAGAADRLTAASRLRPEDPDTLYRLALAEIRAERLEAAETTLRRLLNVATVATGPRGRYKIFGHYQLGQVLHRTGRSESAREQYRAMLALPDRYESHRMAREALGEAPE
jgi:tetratricopeptide (TPR) repeat protein